jgi:hypothetical protein
MLMSFRVFRVNGTALRGRLSISPYRGARLITAERGILYLYHRSSTKTLKPLCISHVLGCGVLELRRCGRWLNGTRTTSMHQVPAVSTLSLLHRRSSVYVEFNLSGTTISMSPERCTVRDRDTILVYMPL